jgi:TonB family protein
MLLPMPSPSSAPAADLLAMPSPSSPPAPALLPMPVAPFPATDPAQARVRVAAAAPSSTAPRQALAPPLVPIARETPAFPHEALAAGLDTGNVKARLTIDEDGNVESVDIVKASHRSFHRAVRDALAHWRFAPGAPGRTTDVDVAFKRD